MKTTASPLSPGRVWPLLSRDLSVESRGAGGEVTTSGQSNFCDRALPMKASWGMYQRGGAATKQIRRNCRKLETGRRGRGGLDKQGNPVSGRPFQRI